MNLSFNYPKKLKKFLLGISILFGAIIAYNLIKGLIVSYFISHYHPPAVTVSTVVAKEIEWQPTIEAVGNFVARNGVEVNSQAAGNVVTIHFDSGQYVIKDAPLIDINDSVEQATLKANQSELALREINYKRQTDLSKRGATPSISVDEARAQLLQAQANVEKTQALIQQKHITAPFAGRLGIRQVNLGQYVTPAQTSIVTLQSMDPLYLEFYLPEQLLPKLHLKQTILFNVEQNPKLYFKGSISAINARVDINTHNIQVQATIANCPSPLFENGHLSPIAQEKKDPITGKRIILCQSNKNEDEKITNFNFIPGMFANIEVIQPPKPHTIVLPATAISYSLYGNSVYLVEKDKQYPENLVVRRVYITTGDQQGNQIVIKSGIKAGDVVVSVGELKLQDGTNIAVNNTIKLDETVDPSTLSE